MTVLPPAAASRALPLRHPAELPTYFFMAALNLVILGALLGFLTDAIRIPDVLRDTGWHAAVQTAAGAVLLVLPGLVIVRQLQRASIRGTAVQLSRSQFPDLYASTDQFARRIGLKATPTLFLANGNGALNAFAAQSGWENNYVTVSNELFANLRNDNREGLRFILGHEIAHIRLHHVALWYQLSLCYTGAIPILGPTLSRLREYSCDRNGAFLEPDGGIGLVLLAAGRYAAEDVELPELVDQGRNLGGFWVELAQLTRSHPWTVRRLWRLHQIGLFTGTSTPGGPRPPRP